MNRWVTIDGKEKSIYESKEEFRMELSRENKKIEIGIFISLISKIILYLQPYK
jgi:hypothetical protein